MKINERKKLLVFFVLMIATFLFGFRIFKNSNLLPKILLDEEFSNQSGFLACDGVYVIYLESDDRGLFVGDKNSNVEDFCESQVVFSGYFENQYSRPRCSDESICPKSAAVLMIDEIDKN